MALDIEKYRKHTDGFDLTFDQKTELLHTVRNMMESAVDRAFGNDTVQHIIKERAGKDELPAPVVIELEATIKNDK